MALDVRLADDHEAERLPGSVGNCVFEVSFLDRLADAGVNPETPVVVYGAAKDSAESAMAVEKLLRAGFTRVHHLEDGLEGWKAAGLGTEIGQALPAPAGPPADGTVPVDLAESRVEWTGRNLLNKHWGTLAIKQGSLEFRGGELVGGEFVFDMKGMKCADLEGSELHDVLIAHLESDDFFDVEHFPEARFVITENHVGPRATPGSLDQQLRGDLTLKGTTKPVAFLISAGTTDDGRVAAQATLSFDRTEWGVLYGSGKFFRRLAGHLVNDVIDLQVKVVAG